MRRRLVCVSTAACLLALLAAAYPAPAATDLLMTGSAEATWLVRPGGDTFDVFVRPAGKEWQWAHLQAPGRAVATVAEEDTLHVLLDTGCLVFHLNQSTPTVGAPLPEDSNWSRARGPLALCAGAGVDGDGSPSTVVAVVPAPRSTPASRPAPTSGPATTQPTTRPSPPPGSKFASTSRKTGLMDLVFYHLTEGQWQPLVRRHDVPVRLARRLRLAVADGTLYVLAGGQDGPPRIWAWRKDAGWRDMPALPWSGRLRALDLLSVGQVPAVIVAEETEEDTNAAPASALAVLVLNDRDPRWRRYPIKHEGKALESAVANPPLFAEAGDQFAMLWADGTQRRFALCPANGVVVAVSDVGVLSKPPPDYGGDKIIETFSLAVMCAILFCTFFLRPRTTVMPTQPPGSLRPGRLPRRALAALIDWVLVTVPISLAVLYTFGYHSLQTVQTAVEEAFVHHRVQAPLAYASVGAVGVFVAYGYFMERRFGWTVGKRLFHLYALSIDGRRLDLREALLRNLTKAFEAAFLITPLFWAMLLAPLLSRLRLRLGDFMARTIVVERLDGGPIDLDSDATTGQPPSTGDPSAHEGEADEGGSTPPPPPGDDPRYPPDPFDHDDRA